MIRPFCCYKSKVISQGQDQVSESQFSKKWPLQGHWCFTNTACFIWSSPKCFLFVEKLILYLSKLKAFADDIINIAENFKFIW